MPDMEAWLVAQAPAPLGRRLARQVADTDLLNRSSTWPDAFVSSIRS